MVEGFSTQAAAVGLVEAATEVVAGASGDSAGEAVEAAVIQFQRCG